MQEVWRLDYRMLNKICAYCSRPSTIIRVATTTGGDVIVATMCDTHGKGEQDHQRDKEGFVMAGKSESVPQGRTDATLVNPKALRSVSDEFSDKSMKEAVESAASEMERMGKTDAPQPINPNRDPVKGERPIGEN